MTAPPARLRHASRRRLLQFLAASPLLPTGEALAQAIPFPENEQMLDNLPGQLSRIEPAAGDKKAPPDLTEKTNP